MDRPTRFRDRAPHPRFRICMLARRTFRTPLASDSARGGETLENVKARRDRIQPPDHQPDERARSAALSEGEVRTDREDSRCWGSCSAAIARWENLTGRSAPAPVIPNDSGGRFHPLPSWKVTAPGSPGCGPPSIARSVGLADPVVAVGHRDRRAARYSPCSDESSRSDIGDRCCTETEQRVVTPASGQAGMYQWVKDRDSVVI